MCSFPPHKTVPTHSSNMPISTTLASGLSLLNVYVHVVGVLFFFFSCSPLFFMLAIGMTTTLRLLSLTCSTQIKHICISCSAFFSPYLDSFQRSLENVILCSTSLRLARPLLVSSSRCLAFCEPCHEPASFYTEGGSFSKVPFRSFQKIQTLRWLGCGGSVKDGGGVWGGLALKFVCPYTGVESQAVPVTHSQSLPDSSTSSRARYRPPPCPSVTAVRCFGYHLLS